MWFGDKLSDVLREVLKMFPIQNPCCIWSNQKVFKTIVFLCVERVGCAGKVPVMQHELTNMILFLSSCRDYGPFGMVNGCLIVFNCLKLWNNLRSSFIHQLEPTKVVLRCPAKPSKTQPGRHNSLTMKQTAPNTKHTDFAFCVFHSNHVLKSDLTSLKGKKRSRNPHVNQS